MKILLTPLIALALVFSLPAEARRGSDDYMEHAHGHEHDGAHKHRNRSGHRDGSHRHQHTAICKDGTYSYSRDRQEACSHRGGVASWVNIRQPK